MAHEGGGNFYFLETAAQIPNLITSELGEALEVVIPRAAIEIELPRRADAELLNRFRSSTGDNLLRVGDLAAARRVLEGTAARIRQYAGDDVVLDGAWNRKTVRGHPRERGQFRLVGRR